MLSYLDLVLFDYIVYGCLMFSLGIRYEGLIWDYVMMVFMNLSSLLLVWEI